MASTTTFDYDAIVIGAGFSGIRALWELRKLGLSAKAFEAGSDVGGTWYWNTYPGARTDSEAWVYAMNFAPGMNADWNYQERYPSQVEVQRYLSQLADRYDLRKFIQFNTRIRSAHFNDKDSSWTITSNDGALATCRYFVPASGPLSIGREPPFPGLKRFNGEAYIASKWPRERVDFAGKRVAVVGTGATGVQILPKIAPVAKSVTLFQRTANYVLPGRNYTIDEHQTEEVRQNYDATLQAASNHGFGLAMKSPGKVLGDAADAEDIKKILDAGWEAGGFHYQFETFDDIFTNEEANQTVSRYLLEKIRAIVKDPATAEMLCPKHPFLAKRPPCGHFYYEAFNRPNVKLVDISKEEIDINEGGVHTASGTDYEFDMIIFCVGFDAGTGALTEMDIRGRQGTSLRDLWNTRLSTFAGILVPDFPNMFMVVGPHVPFGNMPVVVELNVSWIGKALAHMKMAGLLEMDVSKAAVQSWSEHVEEAFSATILAESARAAHAWFVGANVPGKSNSCLFYFGGIPQWRGWLDKESNQGWESMKFTSATDSVLLHGGEMGNARIYTEIAASA